jgi:3D-(3,5/4)-trihydroxycyclohexane-1,2-dione acylhydrolase (decyclizing)
VDYLSWARSIKGIAAFDGGRSEATLLDALDRAFAHPGLSLVSVPVYYGPHPLGGLGAFGRWNVGNWVAETQSLRHRVGL